MSESSNEIPADRSRLVPGTPVQVTIVHKDGRDDVTVRILR
jgi:hypothetical protein